jgi:hypothetical protein
MGIQKVVEELHVELIILDDQNRFGLGVHDFNSPAQTSANPWDG